MENLAPTALITTLNAALDTFIDLDPDGKRKFGKLRGKVFCLEVTAPPVTLYLLPTEHGIAFHRSADSSPDITLSGSAIAFARLGLATKGRGKSDATHDAFSDGRVTLRGDAELGQTFQKILSELDLDWEELLSRYIGDTPAHKLANTLRRLGRWAEKSVDLTRENAADYLTEEKQILVTDLAMQRFIQAVDQTRADVDRLSQRIEKLKGALVK